MVANTQMGPGERMSRRFGAFIGKFIGSIIVACACFVLLVLALAVVRWAWLVSSYLLMPAMGG